MSHAPEKNSQVLQIDPDVAHPDDLLELYGMWIVDEMGKRGWVDLPHRIQNSAERRYVKRALEMGVLKSYTDVEIMAAVTWCMKCCGLSVRAENVKKLYRDLRGEN